MAQRSFVQVSYYLSGAVCALLYLIIIAVLGDMSEGCTYEFQCYWSNKVYITLDRPLFFNAYFWFLHPFHNLVSYF